MGRIKCQLYETVVKTQTDIWNDSCSLEELSYAIDNGAVGYATTILTRGDNPVDPDIINELLHKISDFVKAYEPDGLRVEDFDTYVATVRTLRGFIEGYERVLGVIRGFMLPYPDK